MGWTIGTIAELVGVGRIQVGRWRERYAAGGLRAIEQDLPRGGRKPKVDPAEIVRLTTQTKPEGATQWSTRTLAAVAGVSDTTVQRIWKARGLKPHRVKRFKVSRDPQFVEKARRYRRSVYVPARARAGVVLRREKPGAGAGSHPTRPADEAGPLRPP